MTKLPQIEYLYYLKRRFFKYIHLKYIVVMLPFIVSFLQCTDMPDIRVLQTDNRPPVINKHTVNPGGPIVKLDSSCKKEFSFSEVTELDIEDTLYVRWYVDYDNIKNYQKSSVIPSDDKKSIIRSGDSFTLDVRNSILPNKTRGSIHTVEVILSDRPFLFDSTIPPPFKAIEEGGNYDYISWTVILLEDCY